jgi:antitoxin HicB
MGETNIAIGYRIPVRLDPQPDGGFTVTSPALPELVTEGDTLEEALSNVEDAFAAVMELYQESGRALPPAIIQRIDNGPIETEHFVDAS